LFWLLKHWNEFWNQEVWVLQLYSSFIGLFWLFRGPLWFHMNFRMGFSVSAKSRIRIFLWLYCICRLFGDNINILKIEDVYIYSKCLGSEMFGFSGFFYILEYLYIHNVISWVWNTTLNMKFISVSYILFTRRLKVILCNICCIHLHFSL
jgi:hypothetical protein